MTVVSLYLNEYEYTIFCILIVVVYVMASLWSRFHIHQHKKEYMFSHICFHLFIHLFMNQRDISHFAVRLEFAINSSCKLLHV